MRYITFLHQREDPYIITLDLDKPYEIRNGYPNKLFCQLTGTFKRPDYGATFRSDDITFIRETKEEIEKKIDLFLETEKFNKEFEDHLK